MKKNSVLGMSAVCAALVLALSACTNQETPATVGVAVSKAAVDNATGAGGDQFAPIEMAAARDKLAKANKAMAEHEYQLADELSKSALVDAKLAQSKADSAKAAKAADALHEDIRILREELQRRPR